MHCRARRNGFRLSIFSVGALALGASSSAQAVNGFQLIGYGADQVAVGGAVTANPNSVMTALTNPAGLSKIGERADFSMFAFMPDVSADFTNTPFSQNALGDFGPGEKKNSKGDFYGIPSIGWSAKTGNPDLYFGGGMYAAAGLGAEYGSVNLNRSNVTFNGFSNVSLFRISPAVGYEVAPNFSVGASLNVYMLMLGFRETLTGISDMTGGLLDYDTNFNLGRAGQAFGAGATLGAMFDPVPGLLRLGASYTTKANLMDTKFELAEGDIRNGGSTSTSLVTGPAGAAPAGTYKAAFDFPQQASVGLALMPEGPLTLSADVKWINYKDTLKDFKIDGPTVDGVNYDYNLEPAWQDVWVYAAGLTYKSGPLRVMGGYNYSDAPVQANKTFSNVLFPAIVKHHFTLGANYQLGRNWEVGGAVEYVPEEAITGKGDLPQSVQNAGLGSDSNIMLTNQITSIGMNLGYRF